MAELILKPAPKAIYLGEQKVKLLQLGAIKEWPTCNPTVAGIAIDVLQCTVKEPATGPVTVDWGDGNSEVLTPSNGEVIACHEYATPGVRRVSLSGAVVRSQKVNAGVVPKNTVFMTHGFGAPMDTPDRVYQWDGNTGPAGRDTKEVTPFCDGVFRQHIWYGDISGFYGVYCAFDVSCRGTWWDITGGGNSLSVGLNGEDVWHSADDFKILSQVYVYGIESCMDGQVYYLNNQTWPVTGETWATEGSFPGVALFGTSSGHVMTMYAGGDDRTLRSRLVNKENLLDEFGEPAGSRPGALPPGLDLTMMPILFAA